MMVKYQKIFLKAAWILVGAVLALPLFFSDLFFFPFTFPKTIIFRAAVEIFFIFWLPLAIFYPRYRPKFSWPIVAITFLLILGYLSAILNGSFQRSFWSDFERMMGLLTYTHLWVFFLILISVFKEEAIWRRILFISLSVSVLVSIYGIYQKLFLPELFGRSESTIGNAGFLASYLLVHIFIAVFLLAKEEKILWRGAFFAAAAFLGALALFFTGTRGAFLGFLAGIIIFLFTCAIFSKRFWIFEGRLLRRSSVVLLFIFFISVTSFFFFKERFSDSSFEPLKRLASISLSDRTIEGRLLSWRVALEGIKEKPVLGWGPENFVILFNKHYDPRLFNQEAWFDRSHNIVLDITSNMGVLGLVAFIFLIWATFRIIISERDRWSSIEKGTMLSFGAAYFINALFIFDNALTLASVSLLFAYAVSEKEFTAFNPNISKAALSGVFVSALVLVSSAFYFSVALPYTENKSAKQALGAAFSRVGDMAAVSAYERIVSESRYGDTEPRRLFADFVFDVKRSGLPVGAEYEKKALSTALSLIELNREYESDNARWVVYEANILNLMRPFGDEFAPRAEKLVKDNLSLSPNRQQMYFDLAQALFDQNKTEEALNIMKKAIELEPSFPISHRHRLSYAVLSGDKIAEEEEIGWLENNFWNLSADARVVNLYAPADDWNFLADIYFKAGRFDKAVFFYERFLNKAVADFEVGDSESGKVADYYARFAALQARLGDFDGAYNSALKVLDYDPSRRDEAAVFLKTIGRTLP